MILNYVLYPILVQNPENVHLEGLYLFPLHQHTTTSNITIIRQSCYITYTEQTLNNGDLSRLFGLKPIKLGRFINICLATAVWYIT